MTTVLAPRQEKTNAASTRRRTVDQTLCAATYVCEGFADYTVRIFNGRPRAGAPSATEDPVGLLRHAMTARRLRRNRDVVLCAVTLVVAGVVVGRLAARLGEGPATLLVAAGIVGWTARRILWRELRAWCVRAWKQHREQRRSGPIRRLTGLALAVLLAVVAVLRESVLWTCLGVVALGLVVGWLVLIGESVLAQGRAARIVASTGTPPGDLAVPLRPADESLVAGLAEANVVVYGELRASSPFVGNGFTVRPWKVDIDVRRGALDDDGRERVVEDFDVVDFHRYLEEHFRIEGAMESMGSRRVRAGHRLYVDGRKIPWTSGLLRTDQPLPRTRVDWEYLAEELRHPESAEDRRVYFHLEETSRDGEISVSMFVRPLLQGGHLSIEFVPLVIPPVHPDVEAEIDNLAAGTRDRIRRAARIWTLAVPGTMLGSPARCLARTQEWLAVRLAWTRWRLAARRGRFYNLGAVMSVREGVSWREPDEFAHFVIRDLIRINSHLRDRLTSSIKAYLHRLGISTEMLEEAVTVNNIQNWNVGNVRADMVGFGNHNTFGQPGRDTGHGDNRESK